METNRIFILVSFLIFTAAVLFIFRIPAFTGDLFQGIDAEFGLFQWRSFLSDNIITHRSLPFWNPYVFGGTPFLANIQVGMFYPPEVLSLLVSPAYAITLLMIIHLVFSGVFMAFLCRSFSISLPGSVIGGIVYALNPWIFRTQMFNVGVVYYFETQTWAPLIVYFSKQVLDTGKFRFSLLTGACISLQILAGWPQSAFITQMCLLIYIVLILLSNIRSKKIAALAPRVGFAILSFAIGYALAAIQILPTLELTVHSNRAHGVPLQNIGQPLDVLQILLFIIMPNSVHPEAGGLPFGLGDSFFALFLATAVFSFRSKPWRVSLFPWFVLLFSLLVALGVNTPVFGFLYHIPGFNLFRNPVNYDLATLLSVSLICAMGADRIMVVAQEGRKFVSPASIAALLLCTFGGAMCAVGYSMNISPVIKGGLSYGIAGCLLLITLWGIHYRRMARPLAVWILALFLCLDVSLFAQSFVHRSSLPRQLASMRALLRRILPQDQNPFRVMFMDRSIPWPNEGLALGLQTESGYDSLFIKRYGDLILKTMERDAPTMPEIHVLRINHYVPTVVNLMNIRYIISSSPINLKNLVPAYSIGGVGFIYENPEFLPRAFLVDRIISKSSEDILSYMVSPQFDPRHEIIVDAEDYPSIASLLRPGRRDIPPLSGTSSLTQGNFQEYSPDHFSLSIDADTDGVLVLSEIYYPGWQATIDGMDAPIHEVDYCLRGVVIHTGHHVLSFNYRPMSFKIGLIITLSTLLMWGPAYWRLRKFDVPVYRRSPRRRYSPSPT